MKQFHLTKIDPVKSAGVASLLTIIGSLIWLPAAFLWRSKVLESDSYQQMIEQFGSHGMAEIPAWLIAISPITNGGLVLVSTFITVWIVNVILKRIGGVPYQATIEGE